MKALPLCHNRRCTLARITVTPALKIILVVIIHIVVASLSSYHSCQAFTPKVRPLRFLQSKTNYIDILVEHIFHDNTNSIQIAQPKVTTRIQRSHLHQCREDFRATDTRQQRQMLWSVNLYNIRQHFRTVKQQFQSQVSSLRCTSLFKLGKRFNMHQARRAILTVSFALMILFHAFVPNAVNAAVSGGRMGGGSFKQSSSPSAGRVSTLSRPSLPSPRTGGIYTTPSIMHRTPIIINSFSGSRGWYAPTHDSALITSRVSTKDIILVTGTGMLLAYGFRNNRLRGNGDGTDGLLGSGYTVGSMTVSIDVPDRSSTDNILHKLNLLAMSADTMTKRGLQDLLSSVTLELLRQEKSITSAYTQSKSYPIMGQAEREFQVLSVASQSKVDRLTGMCFLFCQVLPFKEKHRIVLSHFPKCIYFQIFLVNKWNAPAKSGGAVAVTSNTESTTVTAAPTTAIVTINFAMEGDSTILPVIKSREDLQSALSLIASDALVGDCLMTAEVLWSPEDISETLSREATYADFPNLVPI